MSIVKIKFEKIDSKSLFLHTQLASGSLGKDKYSFIQSAGNQCFVLEYKGSKYKVKTADFIKGLLDAVDEKLND